MRGVSRKKEEMKVETITVTIVTNDHDWQLSVSHSMQSQVLPCAVARLSERYLKHRESCRVDLEATTNVEEALRFDEDDEK